MAALAQRHRQVHVRAIVAQRGERLVEHRDRRSKFTLPNEFVGHFCAGIRSQRRASRRFKCGDGVGIGHRGPRDVPAMLPGYPHSHVRLAQSEGVTRLVRGFQRSLGMASGEFRITGKGGRLANDRVRG